MPNSNLKLFLEINIKEFVFIVGKIDHNNPLNIEYKLAVPLKGIENNRISNFDDVYTIIKENIYLIEQKFNYTFKELVLILENFNPSFVSLTGYKKLNGSQILRENITYILNMLKNCIEETELKKTIIHIFNSKFYLDSKQIENLPIGLFGDFYSHELSFSLIGSNIYKNLINIFENCNLRVKKILLKSFIKGANINNYNKDVDTFFQIKLNENNSKIFFFENNSLKFEQNFEFGLGIIIQDIFKITTLKIDTIIEILSKMKLTENVSDEMFLEKDFFKEDNYIKIKKKLINEIALARIKEISEILLFKNVNFQYFSKVSKNIFLEMEQKFLFDNFKVNFNKILSEVGQNKVEFINPISTDDLLITANKLVHFGWKNEAIPISSPKKSLIARFFDAIFG